MSKCHCWKSHDAAQMVSNYEKEEYSEQKDDSSNTDEKVAKKKPTTPAPLPSKATPVPKPRFRHREIAKEREI